MSYIVQTTHSSKVCAVSAIPHSSYWHSTIETLYSILSKYVQCHLTYTRWCEHGLLSNFNQFSGCSHDPTKRNKRIRRKNEAIKIAGHTYEDTIPHPAPARAICVIVGTVSAVRSWSLRRNLYDANTKPFIKATVAYKCETFAGKIGFE